MPRKGAARKRTASGIEVQVIGRQTHTIVPPPEYVDPYEEHGYQPLPIDPKKRTELEDDIRGKLLPNAAVLSSYPQIDPEVRDADDPYFALPVKQLERLEPDAAAIIRTNRHFRAILTTLHCGFIASREALDADLNEAGLVLYWKDTTEARNRTGIWTAVPAIRADPEGETGDDELQSDSDSDDDDTEYMSIQQHLAALDREAPSFERDEDITSLLEDHFRVRLRLEPTERTGWTLKEWWVELT